MGSFKVKRVVLPLLFLFVGSASYAASVWLETDEGLGRYRYVEKDATTYVHYGTDIASWTDAKVWVVVNGYNYGYPAWWVHDSGANKHLSTGDLVPSNHDLTYGWITGSLISAYCAITSGSTYQGDYVDNWRLVDVVNNGAPAANLSPVQFAANNLVMDFTISCGTSETLQRLWVSNTGTLQEGDNVGNAVYLYYETAPGDGFGGTESRAVLWGDYGSDSTANELWGDNALGIPVPSAGLRCYVVLSNLSGDYPGKTACFKIPNDGISLANGLVRVNSQVNAYTQTGSYLTWHTVAPLNGNNYFTTNDRFLTTSSSSGYTNWMTWDSNYLYVGYYGADVYSGNAAYKLAVYLSTNTNTGTAYGVWYLGQQAVLPFRADFVFNFLCDDTWGSAVWTGTAWNWSAPPFSFTSGTDLYRNGSFLAFRIPRSALGGRNYLDAYVQFVKAVSGSEWSYGGVPYDTFADGDHSVRSAANPSNFVHFGTNVWKTDRVPASSSYKTYDAVKPYTNDLYSPAAGSTYVTGSTIVLSNYSRDDVGLYKVEFCTNGGVYLTCWASNETYTRVAAIAASALGAGTHKLFAIAYDTHNRTYSRTNTVTVTANTPPPAPVPVFPANNDSHFYLLKPRFRWTQAADPDGQQVTNFQILVSTSPTLASPRISAVFHTLTTNYLTLFTNYLANGTTYYWAVRASDGIAWGAWSSTNTFTVDPVYVTLDGGVSEWTTPAFGGDNRDQISNGQWQWQDRTNDAISSIYAPPYKHLDLLRFGVTGDTNCLYFMFTVPDTVNDGTYDSPRTSISVTIDTDFVSGSGYSQIYQSECAVPGAAAWEEEFIANVDGTGYYYPSAATNFRECGENWITHTLPGIGEMAVEWRELGFGSVPRRLRLTVNVARDVDGLGVFTNNEIPGQPDFVDCISTNTGDAAAELSDGVNDCYFDINFETNGRVIENRFQVTAPSTAYAGVPFRVVVKALTFLGGTMLDFDRAVIAKAFTNGNAFILSNTGWHQGVTTNLVVINAAGSNKVVIEDKLYTNLSGTSGWIVVSRPDVHINEVCCDPAGANADGQWIELYNRGETVYLTNWAIDDFDGTFPMYRIAKNVVVPAGGRLLLVDDSTGTKTDDLDFSDKRGVLYGDWGSARLDGTQDEIGLFCHPNVCNKYTLMDFMAYGTDADNDEQTAVDAGIWTADDGADISLYTEGSSLVLIPDGDDNNLGSDWTVDHTPTPEYTNACILAANLTLAGQTVGTYPGTILLAYAVRLVDPENDLSAAGDWLSNLTVGLNGTMTTNDVLEAGLWNDNGAGQFNAGFRNNGRTNNLLMGAGAYSNGFYVFRNLSNSHIADDASGGAAWAYLSLLLRTNAVSGRTANPYIPANGIVMRSTYPAAAGPADRPLSNASVLAVRDGYPVVNEYSDARWAGANDYLYQFVEVYNNSAAAIAPSAYGWNLSTVSGGDALSFARGTVLDAGKFLLVTGGSTTTAAMTNYYDENPSSPILVSADTKLGAAGLAEADTPFLLRESNNIIAVIDYTNSVTTARYTVEKIDPYGTDAPANRQASSITNGTPGYLNGFRACEMGIVDVTNYSLDRYTTNNLVLDFYVPNDNGTADTLSMLTIYNNGTAVSSDVTFRLKRDGVSAGLDGDETDLGAFTALGGMRWRWTGSASVPDTGSVTRWRFFVTADPDAGATDGRTVRLQVERLTPNEPAPYGTAYTAGAGVAGFNDGPVDYPVSNTGVQHCGDPLVTVSKTVTNVQLTLAGQPIPGSLLIYALTYSNTGDGNAHNVVFYDRIPGGAAYATNYAGTAAGWTVEFAHAAMPDQSYDSPDYDSNTANVLWVRWKKAVVGTDEIGRTVFLGVTID